MNLTGYVVIVTGASKGVGKTLSQILTNYGATVIGTYNKTKIEANYIIRKCDITNEKNVSNLFDWVINHYKKVDAVINCAALTDDMDFTQKSIDSFMEVVKTNLGGTFLIDKYASLNMKKGTIVNISSTDASDTFSPISMDYAASKAGVENLTKNFAQIVPNLKICALAPAWIDTQTVLEMAPDYLKEEMDKHDQKELLHKENVALKIIDIITKDSYQSGEIIRMENNDE